MDDVALVVKATVYMGCSLLLSASVLTNSPWYTKSGRLPIVLPHHIPSWEAIKAKRLERRMESFRELVSTNVEPPFVEALSPEQTRFFITELLPFIQELALKLPNLFPQPKSLYYLLPQQEDQEITLSRKQIACLLANAFLSTFPEPEPGQQGFNFDILLRSPLGSAVNTCLCIVNYFTRIYQHMPTENVVFVRQVLSPDKIPDWDNSERKLSNVRVLSSGSIENDMDAEFHANFSNKWIGGGLLHAGGYAQEERMFSLRPECIVVMLLCSNTEEIGDNESILIGGAECFSEHIGYAAKFTYSGDFREAREKFEPSNSLSINIVCADPIASAGKLNQFEDKNIHRELCKLYCGVRNWKERTDKNRQIYATSHWGCGINGGNRQLKAIEQLLALSEAGLDVHYYTYGSQKFGEAFTYLLEFLYEANATVGEVATALFGYIDKKHHSSRQTLFEHIIEHLTSIRNGNGSIPVTRGILRKTKIQPSNK